MRSLAASRRPLSVRARSRNSASLDQGAGRGPRTALCSDRLGLPREAGFRGRAPCPASPQRVARRAAVFRRALVALIA
ncbi:hypothetical protein C7S16_7218 [Burkholderia thailandensis]|uniref:Uncharacterized protein n=1 Tax=Burkholderia thailandensis TaxID=57975 RepID=A0AAW9CUA8_BURTH|nr:hypothetical protein [Burkholderia thailandensis]